MFAEHYCCNDFYLTCEHAKLIIILIGDWPIPVAGLPDIRTQYNYSVICSARSSILAHYFLISFSRGRVTARPGSLAFPGRRAPGLQPGQHRPSQGFFAAGSEDSPLDEEGWPESRPAPPSGFWMALARRPAATARWSGTDSSVAGLPGARTGLYRGIRHPPPAALPSNLPQALVIPPAAAAWPMICLILRRSTLSSRAIARRLRPASCHARTVCSSAGAWLTQVARPAP